MAIITNQNDLLMLRQKAFNKRGQFRSMLDTDNDIRIGKDCSGIVTDLRVASHGADHGIGMIATQTVKHLAAFLLARCRDGAGGKHVDVGICIFALQNLISLFFKRGKNRGSFVCILLSTKGQAVDGFHSIPFEICLSFSIPHVGSKSKSTEGIKDEKSPFAIVRTDFDFLTW